MDYLHWVKSRIKRKRRITHIDEPIAHKVSAGFLKTLQQRVKKSDLVFNIDPSCGTTFPAFRLTGCDRHPLINALAKISSDGVLTPRNRAELVSDFRDFFKSTTFETAADVFGTSLFSERSPLRTFPSYACVLPWQNASFEQQEKAIRKSVMIENKPYDKGLTVDYGWAWGGPITEKKLDVEIKRHLKVLFSITHNGYKRSDGVDGDIRGVMLYNAGIEEVSFYCSVGQHRAISLMALGYKFLQCRISRIVTRDSCLTWPNVISGLYRPEEALAIFDEMQQVGDSSL